MAFVVSLTSTTDDFDDWFGQHWCSSSCFCSRPGSLNGFVEWCHGPFVYFDGSTVRSVKRKNVGVATPLVQLGGHAFDV